MKSSIASLTITLLASLSMMSSTNNNTPTKYLYDETTAEHVEINERAAFLCQVSSVIASVATFTSSKKRRTPIHNNYSGKVPGSKLTKRTRLDVDNYIGKMGQRLSRRKYRMDKKSFYILLDILGPHLRSGPSKGKVGRIPNGPITTAPWLSMALRYAAGGTPLDISDVHGVGSNAVTESLWEIVDAIHKAPELDIVFPSSHSEQMDIANGFKRKSDIDIDCCVGAIDGILIWIHKPSVIDEKVIQFGPAKFFCGRKKKFGLNMQAVCDSRGMFLFVDVQFPGSASNFHAFEESDLKSILEREGFLQPGLCLF